MAEKKQNLFINVMTSGRTFDAVDGARMDETVRYILLNSMIFLGGSLLVLFGVQSLRAGLQVQGLADLGFATVVFLAFAVLRTKAPFVISGLMTVVPYMFLCGFLAQSGGAQGSGVLWSYSFPLMAIFLLGMGFGTVLSVGLLCWIAAVLFIPGLAAMVFEPDFAGRTVGVYILVLICTIVYEQTKIAKDLRVAQLTGALKVERDEIAVMKDNLRDGLFLMDRDFVIQPQYSKSLESILSVKELSGMNFLDLLKVSIQQKERDTLADYFSMVFNKSFDSQMLEDINPLHELTYYSVANGDERKLRCHFAAIDRAGGQVLILGTVHDATREAELQLQLSEEENKRQEEMRALFEVIHVEPRVLSDFIEDTEYEFERVNDILKDKTRSSHSVMVEIYQAVHAVKSNAVILGLSSFSTKLHALEQEISVFREKMDISFQEVLHITVELDKIMKIKDGFKDLIEKIVSFKYGEGRMQEEYVLVQTLEKVIEKTSNSLGKKARLVVTGIDAQAIAGASRRLIKEVLTQLVRNSMYHGIEAPEDRKLRGKDEMGRIGLAIEVVDGKILVQLTDDGAGLRFDKIRERARAMHLVEDERKLEDKGALLQFLFAPGFSTAETADLHAGRGMGLSLVRDRVKEARGTIKLQSEEGKGTVFKILLPLEQHALAAGRSA